MPGTRTALSIEGCYDCSPGLRKVPIFQQQWYKGVYIEGIPPKSSKGRSICHINAPASSSQNT